MGAAVDPAISVAVTQRRQRVVALAASLSLICTFCAFWSWLPSWEHFSRFYGLASILPFLLPYGFILLRVKTGKLKNALSLAIAMGCALFAPGIALLRFVVEWQQSWWVLTNIAIALLMQPVLVAAAIWTYRSLPRAPRDWLKLLGSAVYGIVLFT